MQKASQNKQQKNQKQSAKTSGRKASQGPIVSSKNQLVRSRNNVPVQYTQLVKNNGPKITRTQNSTRVVNKEFLGSLVTSSSGFVILKRYRVNPGSESTFPWLSNMARSWETYRFRNIRFFYLPRCGSATASSLMLSPDYDAADAAQTTEIQICSNVDTVEDSAFVPLSCRLDPARMNRAYKSHFCMGDLRFDNTKQDQKTIDAAQFYVAADGSSALSGKLWVEYDIEFHTPAQITEGTNQGGGRVIYSANGASGPPVTTGFSALASERIPMMKNVPLGSSDIAELLQDWQGILNVVGQSSGAGSAAQPGPTIQIKRDGTLLPEQPIDTVTSVNGFEKLVGINGLAGDIISMVGGNPPTGVSWNGVRANFGGASPSTWF